MEITDLDLVVLWQQGDKKAFELIYKRYAVQLLAIAMQKTGDRDLAQEIVQDVFISFYKNKNTADQISSLIAYLYVLLKNKIYDAYRHQLVKKKYEDYATHFITEEDYSTVSIIETRDLEKRLTIEIEKLPPQCRTVFKLSRQKFLPNKQIAAALQISENTVEQHMRKALRILRKSLLHYEKSLLILILLWIRR